MKDSELDDFFRKGLEEPEIPFVQEDWEKMKDKLSGIPGSKSPGWFQSNKMLVIIAGLVFLGSGVWFVSDRMGTGAERVVTGSNSEMSEQIAQEGDEEGETGPSGAGDEIASITEQNGKLPLNKLESKTSDSFFKNDSEQVVNEGSTIGRAGESTKPELTSLNGSFESREVGWFGFKGQRGFDKMLVYGIDFEVDIDRVKKEVAVDKGSRKEKDKLEFYNENRWSLSAVLSPDVSALKLNDIQGLGTSAGVNIEYFIHPNWSINLGGLYAFKTYGADDGYQLPGYGAKPTGVKGDCYIIDVPLNLRFYAINGELDRWYISSGLSSYLMLREKYELTYGSGPGYPTHSEIDVKNENRHYLQVINISMGYERVLSEKLSLQVEPYFKMPMSGVGEGQVSLKSAGALIGLKYSW